MKQIGFTFVVTVLSFIGGTASIAGGVPFQRSNNVVTACSRYGNQTCYTALLQRGAHGKGLVLHHGTRIDCGRDCENTLREATVDFWDTMRENGG
jgi:hypothetical protein